MHAVPAIRRLWIPSPLLLFLLPSLLLIVVFFVLPISLTGIISLTSLDYRFRWDFVGLTNFLMLLQDTIIPRVLLNTGVYVFTTLLLFHLGLGLGLALLTAALPERPAVILRLIWLLPRFTPSVVYVLLWRLLLDPSAYGLLNRLRAAFGAAPVDLLTEHPWSVLVNGLTGASLGLVIFTAAIESIPRDLLRAARVDGATTLHMVWRIILPLLRWPVMFVTTYQTLSLLASFEAVLLLTNGGPFYATEVWTLYAYHHAFAFSAFGYGCAMTFVLVLTYGLITAVGLFYMLPALVLFTMAHKYLVHLPFGVGSR
jgi:inositol-phosphate transport system permease protein